MPALCLCHPRAPSIDFALKLHERVLNLGIPERCHALFSSLAITIAIAIARFGGIWQVSSRGLSPHFAVLSRLQRHEIRWPATAKLAVAKDGCVLGHVGRSGWRPDDEVLILGEVREVGEVGEVGEGTPDPMAVGGNNNVFRGGLRAW